MSKCMIISEDNIGYDYWIRVPSSNQLLLRSKCFEEVLRYIIIYYKENSILESITTQNITPHVVPNCYLLCKLNDNSYNIRSYSKCPHTGCRYTEIIKGTLLDCLNKLIDIFSKPIELTSTQIERRKMLIANWESIVRRNPSLRSN